MRHLALMAAFAAVLASAVVAEEPGTGPESTAKRVLPPQPGQKRFITVQIDPDEQARFIAALPPFAQRTGPAAAGGYAWNGGPEADPNAPTAYPWFWTAVSPSAAEASSARLDLALAGLASPEGARRVPTPRQATMLAIANEYGPDIERLTMGTSVSPALVLAVIGIESGGRPGAVSHAGATGLMQLMPATARRFGVSDIKNPTENIKGGIAYLHWLIDEFGGDPMLVLAGYNAGEGAVRNNGGVPPYRETRDYVPRVLAAWTVARTLCVVPPLRLTDPCSLTVQNAAL